MRKFGLAISLTMMAAVLVMNASAVAQQSRRNAQRSFSGYDNATLHYLHSSGSTLVEQGNATGNLPGTVKANLHVGATFTGSFTIYTRYGQIYGHGSAKPHSGSGGVESFSGTAYITGGTGRYKGAHGRGGMYGTFNRRSYAVVLQTRGTFYF